MVTDAAKTLVNEAMNAGWSVLFRPNVDTGGSPFVTVEGVREGGYFCVTWHTRDSGTYRLFDCSAGESKYKMRDVPLKSVRAMIAGGFA